MKIYFKPSAIFILLIFPGRDDDLLSYLFDSRGFERGAAEGGGPWGP